MKIAGAQLEILGLASALPKRVVSNHDLARRFEGTVAIEKITSYTGVEERRYAEPQQTGADLGVCAANKLFAASDIPRSAVDFLIVCTETPDHIIPATACSIQHQLQLPTTSAAFDVNLGCSGWVYCLGIAQGFLSAGIGRIGLIITADTLTPYIHPRDHSIAFLFGDAATATLVGTTGSGAGLSHLVLGTDGAGARHLIIPAGGARLPRSPETSAETVDGSGNVRSQNHVYMNGPAILSFTLKRVPESIAQCLQEADLSVGDIDQWVLHQASHAVLNALQRSLSIPPERMARRLADVGNTVGSSVPLALEAALRAGRIDRGQRVMLVGYGVGLSWAAALITWGDRTVLAAPDRVDETSRQTVGDPDVRAMAVPS